MNDNDRLFAGARLLVVDDNDISAELAAEMLNNLDVRCVVANDGAQALDILAADVRFDGVLMDCEMPSMDGYAAAKAIRKMPGIPPGLPILAMTGNDLPEDMGDILGCGMNARITKPLSVKKLAGELNRWIRPDTTSATDDAPGRIATAI